MERMFFASIVCRPAFPLQYALRFTSGSIGAIVESVLLRGMFMNVCFEKIFNE